jgi:hypothetical protein
MAVGHGGAWDYGSRPYDSNAALAQAHALGMDGVKIDVRVTADQVPVVAHSSPIESYESLDCWNRKIEEMTAAEVVRCHRFPSSTETFQRLDDVLDWLRGKMVVQLCVKKASDLGRTIEAIHASRAEDYAFIELTVEELRGPRSGAARRGNGLVPRERGAATSPRSTSSWDTVQNPRAFMVEFDPTVAVDALVATRLHPAGIRSFTYDDTSRPSLPSRPSKPTTKGASTWFPRTTAPIRSPRASR